MLGRELASPESKSSRLSPQQYVGPSVSITFAKDKAGDIIIIIIVIIIAAAGILLFAINATGSNNSSSSNRVPNIPHISAFLTRETRDAIQ